MNVYPEVRRVQTGLGSSHIEPPLDQSLSNLEKLRWHAAVATLDTGLKLLVHPIRDVMGRHKYSIQVENSSMSAMPYADAWLYITGISTGAEMALRRERDGQNRAE